MKRPVEGHIRLDVMIFFTVTGREGQPYCLRGKKILSGINTAANVNTTLSELENRQEESEA